MKLNTITILIVLVCISLQTSAQSISNPDTVCAGSNVYYKVPNPTEGSIYTWGIYKSSGSIQTTSQSDSIRIDWDNNAGLDSIWVYETNKASCVGDTVKLKVVRVTTPTAEFSDTKLCFGESLNIIFTGSSPFNVEYTLDGTTIIKNRITENSYSVGGASGNYVLINVSNKYCGVGSLSTTTNAIIGQQLQKLQIYHE